MKNVSSTFCFDRPVRQVPCLQALKRSLEPDEKTRMIKCALGELMERQMYTTTFEGTQAEYWIKSAGTGVWRTARKEQVCRAGRTRHTIKAGDRYLDTGERTPDGVWATIKCCEACANGPAFPT